MRGQDRRQFLKISCLTGLGAVALGAGASSVASSTRDGVLSLDVWRVRPGGVIPVVLEAREAVEVFVVELDDRGRASGRHWGPVPLRRTGPESFEGELLAADGPGTTYRVAAVARASELIVSNTVEVVCARFHVGS